MKEILITQLRDLETTTAKFRRLSDQIAQLLAFEVANFLEPKRVEVKTPLDHAQGCLLPKHPILVPVLRAGLALLYPFLQIFRRSKVGMLGVQRDEKTAIASIYYKNLPEISPDDEIIILDPMIATGGTACLSISALKECGATENKMIFVSVISAPQGIQRVQTEFPEVRLHVVQEDENLNPDQFIIPGLGDYGDRFFDT